MAIADMPTTGINDLATVRPAWGPIGEEVYKRTYSRADSDGYKETWFDTVKRVIKGNISLVDPKFIEPGEEEALVKLMFNFKAIPAGRHIWVSGVPGRQFLFNCHRAGFTERFSRHCEFTFNELMKGGGVGANYSNDYIRQYPSLQNKVHVRCYIPPEYEQDDIKILVSRRLVEVSADGTPVYPPPQYIDGYMRVSDSREGWYAALNRLLEAYFTGKDLFLNFDMSMLRPMGSIIKGFGGIASGPWALAQLLKDVAEFLNTKTDTKLSSLDWMHLDQLIAACVVAGNIRRSARMSIKHWKDPDIMDFINCKKDTSKHWSTNISVEIDNEFWSYLQQFGDSHALRVFNAVLEGMMFNGEPGFVNTDLAAVGERGDIRSSNPCGEIFLEPFENCNLGHVNLGAFWDNRDGADEAFRLMQRYLIRATFGDITDMEQRSVVNRNRRTGVGIFGYQAWCVKQRVRFSDSWHSETGIPLLLRRYKNVCVDEAKRYSAALGIPEPIKHTTVAPTGTIAKLPGTSEGIHPIYARYFIRRIRFAANDPKVAEYFARGYTVEDDIYSAESKVVSFPCKDILVEEVEALGISATLVEDASEISVGNMMAVQAMVQDRYSDNGIAFTMNFTPGSVSKESFGGYLKKWGPQLKGTTAMPDGSRPQAPYERMSKEQFEATGVGTVSQGEMECSTGACPVK